MDAIQAALLAMADEPYKRFQSRLIPTVDPATVIGVRTPRLRSFAKTWSPEQCRSFLQSLPHRYYEENNLHAVLISQMRDYDECLEAVERFLPYVDNWATCDSLRPKAFLRHREALLTYCDRWLHNTHPYTVRFGLEMRMIHGLDDLFEPRFLADAAAVTSQEYYVRMMVAWYFATALTKQYEETLPYLQTKRLDTWVHNKAIQKACESLVVDASTKQYLKTLKG